MDWDWAVGMRRERKVQREPSEIARAGSDMEPNPVGE